MVHGVNNPLHKEKERKRRRESINIGIQISMDHEEVSLKPIILPQSIPHFLTRDLKSKDYNLRSLVFSNYRGEPTASYRWTGGV